MYQIYKLFDPRDQEKSPKYIGITATSLDKRLKRHIDRSLYTNYNWPIINWIKSLIKNNILPTIELIDVALNQKEAFEKEIYYIDFFKNKGLKLCNATLGGDGIRLRKVKQFDMNGKFIKLWESISTVEKELNIHNSKITQVCKGKRYITGNFIWRYEEDSFDKYDISKRHKQPKMRKVIYQYDLNYNLIKIWSHSQEIEDITGIPRSNISKCCRELNKKGELYKAGGFYWRFEENKDIVRSLEKSKIDSEG